MATARRRIWSLAASLTAVVAIPPTACTSETPLGPPGKNMTGPVTTSSGGSGGTGEDESGEGTETGTPGDMLGNCDPLADPLAECGPAMACDLTSGECVPAPGTGEEDDLCASQEECLPGLLCLGDRCRSLCDASVGDGCEEDQHCITVDPPIPGICAAPCSLIFADCEQPGDACKRVVAGGATAVACVPNLGAGLTGDPCLLDTDCAIGYLCTDSSDHTLPCVDGAASCCTTVCDPVELPCFGLEPVCYALGIPGQEQAGFCGAE